jgi:hypothetical protein
MNAKQIASFKTWLKLQREIPQTLISRNKVKSSLLNDLNVVSSMGAEEYTLYRKWLEMQSNKVALNFDKAQKDDEALSKLESDENYKNEISSYLSGLKSSIKISPQLEAVRKVLWTHFLVWKPVGKILDEQLVDGSYDETQSGIFPEVVQCKDKGSLKEYWNLLRYYTSTHEHKHNVGRNLYFMVMSAGQILGIFSLSSDFKDLKGRDEYIGWSRDIRSRKPHVMVNHTAIGSTIVPTQPFGYNYNGGKLIALLTMSDVVEKAWYDEYGYVLAGVTTTSLYGSKTTNRGSQYSNLEPYWKELGESAGATSYEPSSETLTIAREYLRQHYPQEYWQWFIGKNERKLPMATNANQRSISFLYKRLGIPETKYTTGHKRGVYFAHFYENFKEFLRKEIPQQELCRRTDIKNDVASLTEYWRSNHSLPRIKMLMKKNTLKYDYDARTGRLGTFYADLVSMSWEQTRKKYLPNVVTKPATH